MKKTIKGIELETELGDITKQNEVDAVVNAANAQLKSGGGVAGAIHNAAGPELEKETRLLAPIRPGEAVLTRGHGLPNKYIIHCLGPLYSQDKPEDELLSRCYRSALSLAEGKDVKSIAFPAISTGAFGYPSKEAVEVVFNTILKELEMLESIEKIKFVLYDEENLKLYEEKLRNLD